MGGKAMKNSQQLGIGTTGGTLLSIVGQLGVHDMLRTALLAAIGAVVSFTVTWLLQRLWRRGR
ncbi:hypothetical protein GCM10011386_45040 [Parapedobacter defluvii]|uniref:Holin n=2 Tax=Parapedobacter defluvii TaxID=2045106 RepID=A0ABQ1MVK0_9SPHI|nr:hypothetical protein GCM10011386_45040 [Parapedobacter defluvii]